MCSTVVSSVYLCGCTLFVSRTRDLLELIGLGRSPAIEFESNKLLLPPIQFSPVLTRTRARTISLNLSLKIGGRSGILFSHCDCRKTAKTSHDFGLERLPHRTAPLFNCGDDVAVLKRTRTRTGAGQDSSPTRCQIDVGLVEAKER